MLTLLSGVAHNPASRLSEAGIFILLIRIVPIVSGASNQSQSLQSENSASRFPLASLIHCLPPCKAKNDSETRHARSFFLPQ